MWHDKLLSNFNAINDQWTIHWTIAYIQNEHVKGHDKTMPELKKRSWPCDLDPFKGSVSTVRLVEQVKPECLIEPLSSKNHSFPYSSCKVRQFLSLYRVWMKLWKRKYRTKQLNKFRSMYNEIVNFSKENRLPTCHAHPSNLHMLSKTNLPI